MIGSSDFLKWRFTFWKFFLTLCQFELIIISGYSTSSLNANNKSDIQEYIDKQTNILKDILIGYDKRFIPTLPEHPLKVQLQLVVSDVFNLDDRNMELEMLLYIRQIWFDHRLSWNSSEFHRIKVREHLLDKIWIPDIRIRNLKDMKRFHEFGGINMNVHSNGRIYFSQLALVKTSCPMNLHKFPMDEQTCYLKFSSYAYAKSLLQFSLAERKTVVKPIHLPQFYFVGTSTMMDQNEGTTPTVTITLTFQRRFGYYILQIYVPSFFLVLLSWLSFFMDPTDIGNRLALEVTMILSIVFLLGNSNSSLPYCSYTKASDLFIIVSFGFVFMALLQTMLANHLVIKKEPCEMTAAFDLLTRLKKYFVVFKRKEKVESKYEENENEESKCTRCIEPVDTDVVSEQDSSEQSGEISRLWLDKICIVAFPTLYIIFNVSYWSYYKG